MSSKASWKASSGCRYAELRLLSRDAIASSALTENLSGLFSETFRRVTARRNSDLISVRARSTSMVPWTTSFRIWPNMAAVSGGTSRGSMPAPRKKLSRSKLPAWADGLAGTGWLTTGRGATGMGTGAGGGAARMGGAVGAGWAGGGGRFHLVRLKLVLSQSAGIASPGAPAPAAAGGGVKWSDRPEV